MKSEPLFWRPAILFFGVTFLAGLRFFGDYGPHWDEYNNRQFSAIWGSYVETAWRTGQLPENEGVLLNEKPFFADRTNGISHNLCHGPFWELVLYFARKVFLPGASERGLLLMRHASNFLLFFTAVLVFYRTLARVFRDHALGLLGAALLVLHPRIFADSFYNTVDLAFLSFYIFAFCTLLELRSRGSVASAFWHALTCAMLVATRAAGLIVPAMTLLAGAMAFVGRPRERGRTARVVAFYAAAFAALMVFFWPYLWHDPWPHFLEGVRGGVFSGVMPGWKPGPEYTLLWLMVTTPEVTIAFFAAGVAAISVSRTRGDKPPGLDETELALALFLAPIAAAAVLGTTLFNGWRHHYFVYPMFVVVCVFGFDGTRRAAASIRIPWMRRLTRAAVTGLAAAGLGGALLFIVRNHPYEYAYFNALMRPVAVRPAERAVDYWMLSHRQLLEYIAAHDRRKNIRVYFSMADHPAEQIESLPAGIRERLTVASEAGSADYVLQVYDLDKPYAEDPFYTIRVDGRVIGAVYRRRQPGLPAPS